eukprot:3665844-Amphidinium_carterae.2
MIQGECSIPMLFSFRDIQAFRAARCPDTRTGTSNFAQGTAGEALVLARSSEDVYCMELVFAIGIWGGLRTHRNSHIQIDEALQLPSAQKLEYLGQLAQMCMDSMNKKMLECLPELLLLGKHGSEHCASESNCTNNVRRI